ncbi:hypothetical protein [Thermus sp.]|jgi:class 3 adenylate cyclase|uniref:hypothetical protein n=1 Tax=Thermus sp. TaxID=275 RepID=UPI00321FCD88
MRCACGQKNPPEARFCLACGRALGALLPEERRFVSVVFFDLVGSSGRFLEGLSTAYHVLQGALEEAARVARAHGGFVHRFLGDGILVLFGVPRAWGQEPLRALRAAVDMVARSPLPARAGVASGPVLWAPLGNGQAGEPTVLGPAVVLAQRLSGMAGPGEVLTEPTTLALAHHRWLRGENPKPFLKEALREARRLSNPYVHHLALTSLALYHWPQNPKKARVLSQHLLYRTHRTGFLVHLEVARLLRAQLLLESGERVDHLLSFTPSVPLTRGWQRALLGEGGWEDLKGYGILGRWVRQLWRRRGVPWTGKGL